uniref:G_PROTEIN_RECEP_F1_2 domain-containing protein n=1 Tax=Strongyloides venezuelensis TaxID=75913 RepID=A0A0K0G5R6_STRVS
MDSNPTEIERVTIGIIFLILNLLTILGNALLVSTFISKRNYFSKLPFFEFYYHLIFAILIVNFNQLTVIFPSTILPDDILQGYKETIFYDIFCEADTFGYNLSILLLLSLSIDRLLIFAFPRFFTTDNKYRIRMYIILCWLITVTLIIVHRIFSVYKKYNRQEYSLYYEINSVMGSEIFKGFTVNLSTITPIILFISYFFCFIKLRLNNKKVQSIVQNRNWNFERQILLQGCTISLVYELEAVFFLQRLYFVKLLNIQNVRYFNIFVNTFAMLYTGSISVTLYTFNRVAREHLISLFKRLSKNSNKISSTTRNDNDKYKNKLVAYNNWTNK